MLLFNHIRDDWLRYVEMTNILGDGFKTPLRMSLYFFCVCSAHHYHQWEFQDPKMEVLYHIRPYFAGISPYIALT